MKGWPVLAIALATPGIWAADWLAVSGNPQRTGWQKPEPPASVTADDDDDDKSGIGVPLTRDTVHRMQLLWKLKLNDQPRAVNSISAPLIVQQIVTDRGFKELALVAGSSGRIFAVDADLGKLFWRRDFSDEARAGVEPDCPGGLTAAPVIQQIPGVPGRSFPRYVVHVLASDGTLHALNLANGTDQTPARGLLPPNANAHALNLSGSHLYAATSGQCGGAPDGVWSMDVEAPEKAPAHRALSGVDAPTGVAIGTSGTVYAMVAGRVVALSVGTLDVLAAANVPGHASSITPAIFESNGRELVAAVDGSGRLVLIDGSGMKELAASPASELSNGGLATWEDDKGTRWIYAARSASSGGNIVAYRLDDTGDRPRLTQVWQSENLASPGPPVIHGGMVFAISSGQQAFLYAFDAASGKELYSSAASTILTRATGLTVANGRVYVSMADGTLHCFGFPLER